MTAAIAEPASAPGSADTMAMASAAAGALELAPPSASGRALTAGGVRRPYLAPVPDSAPPYDDEVEGPGVRAVHGPPPAGTNSVGRPLFTQPATTIGVADSSAAVSHDRPASASPAELSRPRPSTIKAVGVPSWSSEADIGVVRTATADLPPVNRAASVFARAIIEVVAGHRPVAQLRVHCSPTVYAGLAPRHTAVTRSLPHLLSVRVCEPADGTAEVSAVFRRSERVRALAFRMQGVDGRWRITALQVG